jgi:DNA polymerase-3 subunit epsilon
MDNKTIVFIDLETTGLDPNKHEIIEIGLVSMDYKTLTVWGERSWKVRPKRLEDADPKALEVNGFTPEAWEDAVYLQDALVEVAQNIENATMAGHNVHFDLDFLKAGFASVGLKMPKTDYHRIDTATLGWVLEWAAGISSRSLSALAEYHHFKRPSPHRALDDARCAAKVAASFADGFAFTL